MNENQKVNFLRPELCAKTRPVSCSINGENIALPKQNWKVLLINITEWLIAKGAPNMSTLENKALCGGYKFFLPSEINSACYLLSNGKWLNTKYNSVGIVIIIRELCRHCRINLSDIVITYEVKDDLPKSKARKDIPPPISDIDPAVISKITDIMSKHFPNGYKLDDAIELTRFRSFFTQEFGGQISLNDDEMKTYISACGILSEGKIYIVSAETKEQIKKLAQKYYDEGSKFLSFAAFYANHESYLFNAGVVSVDMLSDIFKEIFPDKEAIQIKNDDIEKEILRVWGDDILLTLDQIAARLQYVPIKSIKSVLLKKPDFIKNSSDTFAHISKIIIDDEDSQAICEAAIERCKDGGHMNLADLPLMEIMERNPEISVEALYDAIFLVCLSEKFNKSGKLIALKDSSNPAAQDDFDLQSIVKKHCLTLDKCLLDDLLNYLRQQIGSFANYQPLLKAANETMVRIDKETFIADKFVNFDVDKIDAAISTSIKDAQYIPLKSFTTFVLFPDCGHAWNLFLLESYCRRFSKQFRFDAATFNSKNVGAVICKTCSLTWMDIIADATTNADIELNDDAVCDFLYENGYSGVKKMSKSNEIIDKAKAMRNEQRA